MTGWTDEARRASAAARKAAKSASFAADRHYLGHFRGVKASIALSALRDAHARVAANQAAAANAPAAHQSGVHTALKIAAGFSLGLIGGITNLKGHRGRR